jgi:hypothetical protein
MPYHSGMTYSRALAWAIVAIPSLSAVAPGQSKTDTPKVIEMITDDDSSGDGSRIGALLTAMRAAGPTRELHWIAATPLSGRLNQTIALFEYNDLASVQRGHDIRQAIWHGLPAASRPRLRSQIWQLAPDQSFGDGLTPWSAAKALTLYYVNTSSGGYDEYAEQQQLAAQLLTKANVKDEEWLGYSLRFGTDFPAFVFIDPIKSIASLDSAPSHADVLPPPVDRNRDAVLRESIVGSTMTVVVIRPELGSATP